MREIDVCVWRALEWQKLFAKKSYKAVRFPFFFSLSLPGDAEAEFGSMSSNGGGGPKSGEKSNSDRCFDISTWFRLCKSTAISNLSIFSLQQPSLGEKRAIKAQAITIMTFIIASIKDKMYVELQTANQDSEKPKGPLIGFALAMAIYRDLSALI